MSSRGVEEPSFRARWSPTAIDFFRKLPPIAVRLRRLRAQWEQFTASRGAKKNLKIVSMSSGGVPWRSVRVRWSPTAIDFCRKLLRRWKHSAYILVARDRRRSGARASKNAPQDPARIRSPAGPSFLAGFRHFLEVQYWASGRRRAPGVCLRCEQFTAKRDCSNTRTHSEILPADSAGRQAYNL